jgi:hypothetical protein
VVVDEEIDNGWYSLLSVDVDASLPIDFVEGRRWVNKDV